MLGSDSDYSSGGAAAARGARPTAAVWIVGKGGVKKWSGGSVCEYAAQRLERMDKAAAAAAGGRRGGA